MKDQQFRYDNLEKKCELSNYSKKIVNYKNVIYIS